MTADQILFHIFKYEGEKESTATIVLRVHIKTKLRINLKVERV